MESNCVLQQWVQWIPMMQQTVLLTAVRGPDGLPKYHPVKYVLRWYRRCILLSAMDGRALNNPWEPNGGSFTGPSVEVDNLKTPTRFRRHDKSADPGSRFWASSWQGVMDGWVSSLIAAQDELPLHFWLHLMHAVEILGYQHPDDNIRLWWNGVYGRMVSAMHLFPETAQEMNDRLGDNREGWLARSDPATEA